MATVESSDIWVVVDVGVPLQSFSRAQPLESGGAYGIEPAGVVKSVGGGGMLMNVGVAIVMVVTLVRGSRVLKGESCSRGTMS
jgi:hypothetical protein